MRGKISLDCNSKKLKKLELCGNSAKNIIQSSGKA